MANEKTIRRRVTKHRRFGISRLFFLGLKRRLLFRAATFVIDANVVQPEILDLMARDTADDRSILHVGVVNRDVADVEPAELPDSRGFLWTARSIPEPNEDRRIHDVAHRDVRDRDILEGPAVHFFKRESARVVEHD